MFFTTIEPQECFQPIPVTMVCANEVNAYVIEPEKVKVGSCGPDFLGTISALEAQKLDSAIINDRRDEASEPLDKALGDLGLS